VERDAMEYRRLGASGLALSALSLGAWTTFGAGIGRGAARDLVAAAWDHGINFFDNAEGYANGEAERVMGDVIADLRLPRDGFAVSSKVMFGSAADPLPMQRGLSRKHVTDACHGALKRLRVEYLDLYFCHRPDPDVPVAETVAAMDALVRQGKVLYWGTSEWPAALVREAHAVARARQLQPPTMEQPEYNLFNRRRVELEYAALYAELGLGLTVWSPLASGVLSGKYAEGIPADSRAAREPWLRERLDGGEGVGLLERAGRFSVIAREFGVEPAALAIAWCLRNPHGSSVILGARRVGQLEANLGALALSRRLDEGAWQRVEATTAG
jgi:voltage-dependent potassium channel beta subunit